MNKNKKWVGVVFVKQTKKQTSKLQKKSVENRMHVLLSTLMILMVAKGDEERNEWKKDTNFDRSDSKSTSFEK